MLGIDRGNKGAKAPSDVLDAIKRSRSQVDDRMPEWRVALEFARGNQYGYVNGDNKLSHLATEKKADGGGKPSWRIRQSRNLIFPILDSKKSAATQRVPGYEVVPSTTDAEAISAAHLAEKIALAGYTNWDLRRNTGKAVHYALTPGEGFAMAYWDNTVGPFINDGDGGQIGLGDVRVEIYGSPEVSWEPGCQFEDSPYYVIQHARPISSIKAEHGYSAGDITPDADVSWKGDKTDASRMAMYTQYLERPSAAHPQGRRIVTVNGRLAFEIEDYPMKDREGRAIDEPCLRRLSYSDDPDSDRDQGLVKQLIDPQRTYNDCMNKISEWKNVALNPQIMAPLGAFDGRARPTDEPGAVHYFNPVGQFEPKWREVPQIPSELFSLADRMQALMSVIASADQLPAQIESGKGVQAFFDRNQQAWNSFIVKLAEWHSAVMRDCLTLVQRHYTEQRLIQFRGRTGWEVIKDFMGADLRGQTDVRVNPASLEARSRDAIEQRVMNYAQLGWVSPEAAMAAVDGGSAEKLVDSYELDISRANIIISKIRSDTFLDEPPRPVFPGEDATDENGTPLEEVPGWMPRAMVDNVTVHKAVFSDWFKTDDWDALAPDGKEASLLYFQALLEIENREATRAQQLQAEEAEQQGMTNAARAPGNKPNPSLPALPPT